jgi:hypothetical protein
MLRGASPPDIFGTVPLKARWLILPMFPSHAIEFHIVAIVPFYANFWGVEPKE